MVICYTNNQKQLLNKLGAINTKQSLRKTINNKLKQPKNNM